MPQGEVTMSIPTRDESHEIPGCWSMSDPEKAQQSESYGLVFRGESLENFGLPTGSETCGL